MANTHNLLLLPGDGIGPEVMAEVERLIAFFNKKSNVAKFETTADLVGGAAYDKHGVAITDAAMAKAHACDAILFGAVGGPKWDKVPYEHRPEAGLLRIRKDLDLFANLRPAICYPALAEASSLKREIVEGLDILILRELTGGVYFGHPRGIEALPDGQRRGVDTQVYTTSEIERVSRVAFELARGRGNKVTSCEKSNVMESGLLWREVVTALHARQYSDVKLEHMLADNAAMQLVKNPRQFDVILTDNLFGDILSDEAAQLTGSLGMLPSAAIGVAGAPGLYEPIHGSAPDIAGQGVANPLAAVLSFAMALRWSLDRADLADRLTRAVETALDRGARTRDLGGTLGSAAMGDAVLGAL